MIVLISGFALVVWIYMSKHFYKIGEKIEEKIKKYEKEEGEFKKYE